MTLQLSYKPLDFRGKSKINGKWCRGTLSYDWDNNGEPKKAYISFYDKENKTTCREEVDIRTISMYSMIRDKNGDEICEGDIVEYMYEFMDNPVGWVVKYAPNFQGFEFDIDLLYDMNVDDVLDCLGNLDEQMRLIVGNVFDNPELLAEYAELCEKEAERESQARGLAVPDDAMSDNDDDIALAFEND